MDNTQRELARLKSQLNSLGEELDSLIAGGNKDVKNLVSETNEHIQESLEQIKEYTETAKEQIKKSAKQVGEYVHENPWHVVAAGVALGLVAGFIISRKD